MNFVFSHFFCLWVCFMRLECEKCSDGKIFSVSRMNVTPFSKKMLSTLHPLHMIVYLIRFLFFILILEQFVCSTFMLLSLDFHRSSKTRKRRVFTNLLYFGMPLVCVLCQCDASSSLRTMLSIFSFTKYA